MAKPTRYSELKTKIRLHGFAALTEREIKFQLDAKERYRKNMSKSFIVAGKANFANGRFCSLRNQARILCFEQVNIDSLTKKQLLESYTVFFETLQKAIDMVNLYNKSKLPIKTIKKSP